MESVLLPPKYATLTCPSTIISMINESQSKNNSNTSSRYRTLLQGCATPPSTTLMVRAVGPAGIK